MLSDQNVHLIFGVVQEIPILRNLKEKAEHGEKGLKVLDAMQCKACNVWKTH